MNQYIITDEKLQQLMTRKRKNPLGEGHGSDLSLADWEIHTIVDEVYHHPYQSERDRVLNIVADIINNRITYLREEKPEYFIRHRERGNFNELQATEGEFLLLRIREELRQKAGEQG